MNATQCGYQKIYWLGGDGTANAAVLSNTYNKALAFQSELASVLIADFPRLTLQDIYSFAFGGDTYKNMTGVMCQPGNVHDDYRLICPDFFIY